jgi:hypothetical protein
MRQGQEVTNGAAGERPASAQPAEPLALVVQGKDQIAAFACGKCHYVASSPKQYIGTEEEIVEAARSAARTHCGPWFCACGAECDRYRTQCSKCWTADANKRQADRTAAAIAKAKRVTLAEYDGEMLYLEGRDRYVTPDEIEDMRGDGDLPEYAWGCSVNGFSLDADRIIEGEVESGEHHEDAVEWLQKGATEALQRTLDAWAEKYAKNVRSFFPDYSVLVELGEVDAEGVT